jgi:hypothetical protein
MPRPFALCAAFLLLAVPLRAQKNEAGLISAWEREQKADPNTVKIEKTSDKHYHFSTKLFPFDGEVVVRNTAIQSYGAFEDQDFTSGTVEVELARVSEDFYRTFAVSYAQWTRGNTFYWDSKSQNWMTAQERMKHAQEVFPFKQSIWTTLLLGGGNIILILLVVVGVLFFTFLRYNRRWKEINERAIQTRALSERAIQLSEKNVQIQEEHLKVLQEIRDHLKPKSES